MAHIYIYIYAIICLHPEATRQNRVSESSLFSSADLGAPRPRGSGTGDSASGAVSSCSRSGQLAGQLEGLVWEDQ